MKQVKSTV